MNKGRVSEKEGSHRRQRLTEARVSQKARPHGSQGLTEGQVSQKPEFRRKQGFTEARASQKGKISQRVSQKGRASQKPGSRPLNRRQGLTEVQKPSLATSMRITYDAMQGLTQQTGK